MPIPLPDSGPYPTTFASTVPILHATSTLSPAPTPSSSSSTFLNFSPNSPPISLPAPCASSYVFAALNVLKYPWISSIVHECVRRSGRVEVV